MEDEYEDILAQLTESQKTLLEKLVDGMRPADATETDMDALEELDLLERPIIGVHQESHTGNRNSETIYGAPGPSDLGRDVVKYLKRRRR